MKKQLLFGFAIAMMVFATSCGSKMPQEKIDAANAAMESAIAAQADIYMATEFTALQDSMAMAMQGIEAEAQSTKKFDTYATSLVNIKTQADAIAAAAPAKKEEVKMEATNSLANVKTLLDATKASVEKAAKDKKMKAAAEEMNNELNTITVTVTEVETAIAGDTNYAQALSQLNAAQAALTAMNDKMVAPATK